MIDETIMEGPTVEEALDAALDEMGVQQDAIEYEVLSEPGAGLFGGGAKAARVRVWLKPGSGKTSQIGPISSTPFPKLHILRVLAVSKLKSTKLRTRASTTSPPP